MLKMFKLFFKKYPKKIRPKISVLFLINYYYSTDSDVAATASTI